MTSGEHARLNLSKDVPICAEPLPSLVMDFIRANSPADVTALEVDAYREFCGRYQKQSKKKLRIVMQRILNWTLSTDGSVTSLRYALGEMLDDALKTGRKALRANYPDEIYRAIGDPIAWSLHWKETNIQPRTPSNQLSGQPRSARRRYSEWTAEEIAGAFIEIGIHRLSIATAVEGVVKSLEGRYGLDFRQMEKDFQRREKVRKL